MEQFMLAFDSDLGWTRRLSPARSPCYGARSSSPLRPMPADHAAVSCDLDSRAIFR